MEIQTTSAGIHPPAASALQDEAPVASSTESFPAQTRFPGASASSAHADPINPRQHPADPTPQLALYRTADRVALGRYAPPAMLVDEQATVLQLRGEASQFLNPSPGAVSWKLERVLRNDIAKGVLDLLQQCIQADLPVSGLLSTGVADRTRSPLRVDVLPILGISDAPRSFLISLDADGLCSPGSQFDIAASPASPSQPDSPETLQQQLSATRTYLLSTIRERDEHNQELLARVEAVQNANLALQSRTDELAATAAQLQSANISLRAENGSLHQRQQEKEKAAGHLADVLTSLDMPVLTLSNDLHILHCTPSMQKLAGVTPGQCLGAIQEQTLNLKLDDLTPILHEVLETLTPREFEVQDRSDRWYLLRIRPNRTAANHIVGLVMVLTDIDRLRHNRQELLNGCEFLQSVFESVPVPVVVVRRDSTIHAANIAFRSMSHMRSPALTGRFLPDLLNHLWGASWLRQALARLLSEGERFEVEHSSNTADQRTLLIKGQMIHAEGQSNALISLEDVTLRRHAEAQLKEERLSLQSAVASAERHLTHTQQQLRSLTAHLFNVQDEERQRVARELHDDISQRLSFLELLLKDVPTYDSSSGQEPDQAAVSPLAEVRKHLSALNTDVRTLSHQLHPAILDDLGLSAALRSLVTEFGRREDMVATYIGHEIPDLKRQPAIAAIYRIAQEALRNVAKHAGKTHVKVILEAEETLLRLQVVDLGIGFDQESELSPSPGLGMISMKERAHMAHGTLTVRSMLGYGTTVQAEIPFDAQA